MRKYHQQVYAIDVALGMIRKEVEDQGITDNTVIIFTSDNGFICGSHGYGSKVLPMEESSRVPLIIYDPSNKGKTWYKVPRCNMLTGNIDIAPTILELAGIKSPENIDGKSLLGLLTNPFKGGHEQLALMNTYGPAPTKALTVVTRSHKYTYWWYSTKTMQPTEELFDLENDPHELTNLAKISSHKNLLDQMRKKYDQQHTHLQQHAVNYNKYPKYKHLFDRNQNTLDDR